MLYVVTDPVMVSTSKDALTLPDAVEALCDKVFPHSHLITPNIDEASRLAGFRIRSIEDMDRAAVLLRDRYRCAFLVKGGDLSAAVLSSAIATFLGAGYPLRDAVQSAVVYVHNAIEAAASLRIGHGHGPLRHFYNV